MSTAPPRALESTPEPPQALTVPPGALESTPELPPLALQHGSLERTHEPLQVTMPPSVPEDAREPAPASTALRDTPEGIMEHPVASTALLGVLEGPVIRSCITFNPGGWLQRVMEKERQNSHLSCQHMVDASPQSWTAGRRSTSSI
ncbi:hypothetical protein SRHO_G00205710 [Serrasalmus rhombeus]